MKKGLLTFLILDLVNKIKLFIVYSILVKLVWASPFLVLIPIGAHVVYHDSAFKGMSSEFIVTSSIILLFSYLILLIYISSQGLRYFKKKRGESLFSYLKLSTFTTSKRRMLITLTILLAYTLYASLFRLPIIIKGLDLIQHPIIGNLYAYIILTILAATWEEICCRGFVLTKLSEKMNFQSANILTALIFVGAHYFLNDGRPDETTFFFTTTSLTIASVSIRFLLGYMAGIVTRESKSVWPAAALHSINNLV